MIWIKGDLILEQNGTKEWGKYGTEEQKKSSEKGDAQCGSLRRGWQKGSDAKKAKWEWKACLCRKKIKHSSSFVKTTQKDRHQTRVAGTTWRNLVCHARCVRWRPNSSLLLFHQVWGAAPEKNGKSGRLRNEELIFDKCAWPRAKSQDGG